MHRSWFEYNLSRPFPYRWFTPVTVAGGIILAVIFSLANLGPSGYYLRTVYTNDPNSTSHDSDQRWFMKAPFNWVGDLDSKCSPLQLSVGDRFYTTNQGFSYQLTGLSQWNDEMQQEVTLASVPYLNNTLEKCRIMNIESNLRKMDNFPPPSWWYAWSESSSVVTAQCTVASEQGYANVTMDTYYRGSNDIRPDIYNYVIKDNYTTHQSVWWGTRLLNAYWNGLLGTMASLEYPDSDSNTFWIRGRLSYKWNNSDNKSIRDMNFFNLFYTFVTNGVGIVHTDMYNFTNVYNNKSLYLSPVFTEGLHFAKIMHSLIAVDLGNENLPSLLLNEEGLRYAVNTTDDMNRQPGGLLVKTMNEIDGGWREWWRIPKPGDFPPAQAAEYVNITSIYKTFTPEIGALGTKEATFLAQYLCSVPEPKSTGTLLLAIVLADLVFLQASWKLFKTICECVVAKQDPTAMLCPGCLDKGLLIQDVEVSSSKDGARYSMDSYAAPG